MGLRRVAFSILGWLRGGSALLGSDWIGSMDRIQSSAGKFTGAPGAPKKSNYLKEKSIY
jgi:hypothetical protein